MAKKIKGYKAFDKSWKCRDFQYEVGKTYKHEGKVEACSSGFHACEYPMDVFAYYPPADSVFAEVEQSGDFSRENSDSKVASSKIKIKAQIDIPGLVKAAFEYVKERCTDSDSNHATGDSSASSSTGYRSASSSTGYSSASSSTGDRSASSSTGYRSASSSTGYSSASSSTGYSSASSSTGYRSASSSTGNRSASSSTGYSSASSSTGDSSASSSTGDRSASSSTGNRSASSSTGDRSASSSTGYRSASLTTGSFSSSEILEAEKVQHAVAISAGYKGKARAPEGSAIVLCYRNDDGELIHIRSAICGKDNVKPNVWYSLNENGDFVETDADE